MNHSREYFVKLISSFLNQAKPPEDKNVDWKEIYTLGDIHNVTAIVAQQVLLLPDEYKPDKALLSLFKQQMGYTVIEGSKRDGAIDLLKAALNKGKIDFIFVKGSVIKSYYPVSEFRTSGDIDIIVRQSQIEQCENIFKNSGYGISSDKAYGFSFDCNEIHIEIHSEYDCDHDYFKNIFALASKCENSYEYKLDDETQLLYILCHIIKHFKYCGAGIRMFIDVDVLLRHISCFNYNAFIVKCKEINIEAFVKYSFSLCNYLFNTPVETEFNIADDKTTLEIFENEILDGGSFGFEKRNLGDYYLSQGVGTDGKNTFSAKIKALLHLVFPLPRELRARYRFADKCPVLLPISWLCRLFEAIFSRGKHSINTISSIINSGEEKENYQKLLNELNIK